MIHSTQYTATHILPSCCDFSFDQKMESSNKSSHDKRCLYSMRLSFLSDNHHDGGSAGDKGGMQHLLQHCSILQWGDTSSYWQFCPAPGSDISNKHYITGGHSSLAQVLYVFLAAGWVSGSADQKGLQEKSLCGHLFNSIFSSLCF